MPVSAGTIIRVDFERVDQRGAENRIVQQPRVIAGTDEMAVAEQVDLIEAEP